MTLPRITDDPKMAEYQSMFRKARRESLSPDAERRIATTLLAPSAALAKPAGSSGRAFVVKAVIGASIIVIASAFGVSASKTSARTPAAAAPSAATVAAPSAPAQDVPPPAEITALSVHDLPEAAPPVTAAQPAPIAAPDDSLGAEAALLRAVREDIAGGRSADALSKLDRYDQRFRSKGAMTEEASVARVEALLQAEKTREARALATHLLDERPNGPFARKLRSLLGRQAAPAQDAPDTPKLDSNR